jgi:acetyltransferase
VAAPVPDDLAESFQPVVGVAVTLRPLRPQDVDIESAFVSGLSPATRQNRLLGGVIAITREYIERLTKVDYSRDMALAAIVMLEKETLVGVARYALEDAGAAEFAIVLADAWQGRGIGGRLLRRLAEVARRRGVRRLYGDILSTNRPMLGLVQKLGFTLERNPDDATLTRATLSLAKRVV